MPIISVNEAAHWYSASGEPSHFQPKKSGEGTTPTTLRHARELRLLPSVTNILRVIDRPALMAWRIEQACLAVLTAPRREQEPVDAFVQRVLGDERQHEEEASKAADRGTEIHDAIGKYLIGDDPAPVLAPYLEGLKPLTLARLCWTERVLVGNGYAGRGDTLIENNDHFLLLDFKTCKRIPRESYPEQKIQLSAYANAIGNTGDKPIRVANFYLQTTEPTGTMLVYHDDWQRTFREGFLPAQQLWCHLNNYDPRSVRIQSPADVFLKGMAADQAAL